LIQEVRTMARVDAANLANYSSTSRSAWTGPVWDLWAIIIFVQQGPERMWVLEILPCPETTAKLGMFCPQFGTDSHGSLIVVRWTNINIYKDTLLYTY
jgi:hypothetical protein